MSGVETTLHGSMDWSRRLLLLPASSILLSSLKLDLQFFLQKAKREHYEQRRKFVAFHMAKICPSIFVCNLVIVSHFLTLLFVADLNPRIRSMKIASARMVAMFLYIYKYPIHL
jgi:hypothetical protein